MSTFNQMVSRVQGLVGNHTLATATKVGELVNSRHRGLLESYEWSRRKQDILIATAIDKTAGTIALVSSSGAVTGTSTAFAASDVGRSLIIADQIFTVYSRSSTTAITLGDANGTAATWPGANASGESYVMFTQRYSLGTGIEQIIGVQYKGPLTEVSEEFLDSLDAVRSGTGDPGYFARTSRGSNDDVRIEVYPRPASAIAINVKVELGHTDLTSTQTPIVPSGVVEWWAAVDACFYLYAKTEDDKWLKLSATYEKHAAKSEEFEHNQDNKKFGQIQQVRDVNGGVGLGNTDFGLDHDV